MRSFIAACIAAIAIAVVGYYVLDMAQKPSSVVFSTEGVRL
jgi:hypothetical protein